MFHLNAHICGTNFVKVTLVFFFSLDNGRICLPANALENGLAMVATFLLFWLSTYRILQYMFCTWILSFSIWASRFLFLLRYNFFFSFRMTNTIQLTRFMFLLICYFHYYQLLFSPLSCRLLHYKRTELLVLLFDFGVASSFFYSP